MDRMSAQDASFLHIEDGNNPMHVGNVAVFLGSELSRCVTGATIFADNGFNVLGVAD